MGRRLWLVLMNRVRVCISLICVVMVCMVMVGCTQPPFARQTMVTMPKMDVGQLLDNCWLCSGHRYLCHHSGLLEVAGRKIPLEGVVKIDTVTNEARLVAMDTMGVKLFDLSVASNSYQLNYLLPVLEQHKQLPQMVAKSVQNIFLSPYPDINDQLQGTASAHVLVAPETGVRFKFVGVPPRLAVKSVNNRQQHWQVDYYHYKNFIGNASGVIGANGADREHPLWAPTGIVLTDTAGFSLTLWVSNIRELL